MPSNLLPQGKPEPANHDQGETMDHLGIDLSKAYFDVTLLKAAGDKAQSRFENNGKGFKELSQWLKAQQVSQVRACMEATNLYWEKLAQFLYEQGHTVYVVNPARITGHAMSQLRRSKTDKQDVIDGLDEFRNRNQLAFLHQRPIPLKHLGQSFIDASEVGEHHHLAVELVAGFTSV
jgi:hypothetical protein